MENKDIEEALTNIDNKYILETISMMSKKKKGTNFRKRLNRLAASAAAVIVISLTGLSAVTAAGNIQAYEVLHSLNPQVAEALTPVNESSVSNGIEMTVEAINVYDDSADICVAFKDLEGDRIDETTDMYDSYDIYTGKDQIGGCEFVEYDEENQTARYLLHVQNMNGEKIDGKKINFTVGTLLLKKKYTAMELDNWNDIPYCKETELIKNDFINGFAGLIDDMDDSADYYAIKASDNKGYEPVDKISLLGYGFIDDKLHIKVRCHDSLEYDNHALIYLKKGDEKINDANSFYYIDENGISYEERVFDVTESELDNIKLCGEFVTCDTKLSGDWKVSVVIR